MLNILSLLFILLLPVISWAEISTGGLFSLPSVVAAEESAGAEFHQGLQKVDTRLGKEVRVGDPGYGTTFAQAVKKIASTPATLFVPPGTHAGDGVVTPPTLTLRILRGATFTVDNGTTLTIHGTLEAGLYQIFSCTGTGKVVFGGGAMVYPQWFGAVADNSTNCNISVKQALDSIDTNGGTLIFPPGLYKQVLGRGDSGSPWKINHDNMAVLGYGAQINHEYTSNNYPVTFTVGVTAAPNNVTIAGLRIRNVRTFVSDGQDMYNIMVSQGNNITLKDLVIERSEHMGIFLGSASGRLDNITIDNVKVLETAADATAPAGCVALSTWAGSADKETGYISNLTISNSYFQIKTHDGIILPAGKNDAVKLSRVVGFTITNTIFDGGEDLALYIGPGNHPTSHFSQNGTISNCVFKNSFNGVLFAGIFSSGDVSLLNIAFNNNIFYNLRGNGIQFRDCQDIYLNNIRSNNFECYGTLVKLIRFNDCYFSSSINIKMNSSIFNNTTFAAAISQYGERNQFHKCRLLSSDNVRSVGLYNVFENCIFSNAAGAAVTQQDIAIYKSNPTVVLTWTTGANVRVGLFIEATGLDTTGVGTSKYMRAYYTLDYDRGGPIAGERSTADRQLYQLRGAGLAADGEGERDMTVTLANPSKSFWTATIAFTDWESSVIRLVATSNAADLNIAVK